METQVGLHRSASRPTSKKSRREVETVNK